MLSKVYVIRDSKAQMYNTPFFSQTHGTAERSFQTLAKDEQSVVNKYPGDYDLYYLGTYDDISGEIKPEQPQHVVSGLQVTQQA